MNDLHPFLAAVQAAHEAYGLPEGVTCISVNQNWLGDEFAFGVSMGAGRRMVDWSHAHAADLPAAYAACLAKERAAQAAADSDHERARRALVAAGLSPELLAK